VRSESSRVAMWEMNEAVSVIETCHTVAHGNELFCNCTMADDDTWDCCRMVCTNKETPRGRWNIRWHCCGQRRQTIRWDTEVTDAAGVM
jgi:hypothetical protein